MDMYKMPEAKRFLKTPLGKVTLFLNLAGLVVAYVKVREASTIVHDLGTGTPVSLGEIAGNGRPYAFTVSERVYNQQLLISLTLAPGLPAAQIQAVLRQQARRGIARGAAPEVTVVAHERAYGEDRVVGVIGPASEVGYEYRATEEGSRLHDLDGYRMVVYTLR
jgi:hypothetical protein